MQAMDQDGVGRMPEMFNQKRMNGLLKDPDVKEVRVFRLKKGTRINIDGHNYKIIAARPNGKITMRPV
ncbi:MAG: hypothetical protein JRD68_13615 [Deltaproteobacteria bacterium]|nr:hypothetical protein [Deltaproteobacteria bacterium]